jgi:hypothetical protein
MITVIHAVDKKRKDSFWYRGQVAYIYTDHGKYSLEAVGDIKVMFEPDDNWYINDNAITEALQRNLFDKDLIKLSEHDGWGNNNWFEVVFIKDGKIDTSGTDDVCYEYDEAMEMLKTYVEERIYA